MGPDGTTEYCADGNILVLNTQTDCSGNYAFTPGGNNISCSVALGKWIANPHYSPLDIAYNPDTQNWQQFIEDPTVSYRYCNLNISLNVVSVPGGYAGPNYNNFNQGTIPITDVTQVSMGGGATPCGSSQNPAYGRPQQNTPQASVAGNIIAFSLQELPAFTFVSGLPVLNPLSGTFTINIVDQFHGANNILTSMIRGGKYYYVRNTSYNLEDTCTTTETTTSVSPYLSDTFTNVDWPNLNYFVIASTIPAPGWTDGYPGSNPNVYGPYNFPQVPAYPIWNYGTGSAAVAAFQALLKVAPMGCVEYPLHLEIILIPSTPVSPLQMVADYCEGTITVAWITQNNLLLVSNHRSPSRQIGNSLVGWDMPYTPSFAASSTVTTIGMTYLVNKLLSLFVVGTTEAVYLNTAFGDSASWNSGGSLGGSLNGNPGPRSRGMSGLLEYSASHVNPRIDRSVQGNFLLGPNVGNSCFLGRGGFFDFGSKYGVLYTNDNASNTPRYTTYWYASTDGVTWSFVSTPTAITGYVCSAIPLPSGTILGLSYDTTSQLCTPFRSRDQGATWEFGSSHVSLIPVTEHTAPPMLVSTPGGAYAVWVLNDHASFAFTSDEGNTWS